MDAKYLAEIEARCEAATPGPWKPIEKGNTVPSHAVFVPSIDGSVPVNICSGISPKTGNAAFISHSRADIPALLAEVERQNCELSRIRSNAADDKKMLQKDNAAKDRQIATLEKALGLAEDMLTKMTLFKSKGGWNDRLMKQAQEQEREK